ncbi:hypothetical protein [Aeromonas simiae]|uniref:hypothetical protein n=1 Tax=Aeromonas simiae TaxID=218936 RepID=UPI0005A78FB4
MMRSMTLMGALLFTPLTLAEPQSLQWQWRSHDGQEHHIRFDATARDVATSHRDMQRLDAALNAPLETLFAQMGQKLQHTLTAINQSSPASAPKFSTLDEAFSRRDDTPESLQFWQAYHQYQSDAFYEMRIAPCVHPSDRNLPCVRPNYSQLFYELKGALRPLAQQFSQADMPRSVALAQEWLAAIPSSGEQMEHFAPPLQALQRNQADSDERALLMAALVAELAPQYPLSIIYPDISVGSVSPAWLAISADSGIKGETVLINHQSHVLLTGSPLLVQQMMLGNIRLISEPLY